MPDDPPDTMTTKEMKRIFPNLTKRHEMVVVGEEIYKREGDQWRRLEGAPRCDTQTESQP